MDKRSNNRRRVSAAGTLRSGGADIHCSIIDISPTGARVRVAPGGFLSNDCQLASALFAEAVPVRIVWRRGVEIGVRFKANIRVFNADDKRGRGAPAVSFGSWRKRAS